MSSRHRLLSRMILSLTLIAAAFFVMPAGPAAAAGSWQGVSEPVCTGSMTQCGVGRGHQTGSYAIGTRPLNFLHSNGIRETFVIGTDANRSVWHTWQRYVGDPVWTPWTRIHNASRLSTLSSYDNTPGIRVKEETTTVRWCIRGPNWNAWFSC